MKLSNILFAFDMFLNQMKFLFSTECIFNQNLKSSQIRKQNLNSTAQLMFFYRSLVITFKTKEIL